MAESSLGGCIVNKINENKSILIVGGSTGIGLALANQAVKQYKKITIIAREKTPEIRQLNIDFIKQDFNNIEIIRATLQMVKPNTIILCVAQGLYGDVCHLENDQILNCINTTYLSTIFWIKEAINILPPNSKIAWLSSLTAKIPHNNWSVYASAKAGVEHFISSIREKAEQKEISITVCYPSCVATGFHEKAGTQTPKDAIKPSEISEELLTAIESGLTFWAAPLDRDLINEINQMRPDQKNQFKELVK
jgi:short-subunit dehydrogenase